MVILVQQPSKRVQALILSVPTGGIVTPPNFPGITLKKLISDALTAAALAGEFISVTYDMAARILLQGANVAPSSVETNELRAGFQIETRHGREFIDDRNAWTWELSLRFDQEVICERFEAALTRTPLVISRDPSNGVDRAVILHLLSATYEHPPRGGASNGTEVSFRFSADLCPL